MPIPILHVLAGVNGAGKSSIGGHVLTQAGLSWYNPDSLAHALVTEKGYEQQEANALAWEEGQRQLTTALELGQDFAFETTLGGATVTRNIAKAVHSHEIHIWYCGLNSPELHLARVRQRVASGGHDIPEEKIRERWAKSMANLIKLMPLAAQLNIYDNSAQGEHGQQPPAPQLLLSLRGGKRAYPATLEQAKNTPDWAKPALEAAFELDPLEP